MSQQQRVRDSGFDRRAIPGKAREGWWTAPDGAAIRRIDWSSLASPARGSLLFLPGRADFYEKYLETLNHWHDRGWQVTSVDWRGQCMSGRLGLDDTTGHVEDFGIWVGDLEGFWCEWAESSPGPHVLVAHSMGGHIALRALAEGRIDPVAVVLSAPMLSLSPDWIPRGLLRLAARIMVALRGRNRPAWSGSEKPGRRPEDRIDLLTHDTDRFADELWWRQSRKDLSMGAPSWGWIERALASMAVLARSGYLERIAVPVLVLAARVDRLVGYGAIERAARRLPDARLITFGAEARHEILREADPVRDRAIAAIDAFLDERAPGGASAA